MCGYSLVGKGTSDAVVLEMEWDWKSKADSVGEMFSDIGREEELHAYYTHNHSLKKAYSKLIWQTHA